CGDRRGHLERRGDHRASRREVDLAEPDAIGAPGLGPVRQLEDVPEGAGLAGPLTHLLDEESEVHPPIVTPPASRRQGCCGKLRRTYGEDTSRRRLPRYLVWLATRHNIRHNQGRGP